MEKTNHKVAIGVFDAADIDPLFKEICIAVGPDGVLAAETKGSEGWPVDPDTIKDKLKQADFDVAEQPSEDLEQAWQEVRQYLRGQRKRFDLKKDFSLVEGQFQQDVLEACSRVDHGETVSYAQLASRIGRPGAARAVGTALGHNPLALIVPCHRVLRENGDVGGYASGTEVKKALLEIERDAQSEEA